MVATERAHCIHNCIYIYIYPRVTVGSHAQSPTTPNGIVACKPATNKADPKLALKKAADRILELPALQLANFF